MFEKNLMYKVTCDLNQYERVKYGVPVVDQKFLNRNAADAAAQKWRASIRRWYDEFVLGLVSDLRASEIPAETVEVLVRGYELNYQALCKEAQDGVRVEGPR